MANWHMLTLVGEDKRGIVAAVTEALFAKHINLGEASMMRLGGNFTIMMMVSGAQDEETIRSALASVTEGMGLRLHIDAIAGGLHRHIIPNVQVRVSGADRAGIVAQITGVLAEAGMNILDLCSDVAGSDDQPVYIMQIEGLAEVEVEDLEAALAPLRQQGIQVDVSAVDTLVG